MAKAKRGRIPIISGDETPSRCGRKKVTRTEVWKSDSPLNSETMISFIRWQKATGLRISCDHLAISQNNEKLNRDVSGEIAAADADPPHPPPARHGHHGKKDTHYDPYGIKWFVS